MQNPSQPPPPWTYNQPQPTQPTQPQPGTSPWTQTHPQSSPWAYQQSAAPPWMTPEQYIAAQMQMAATFTQPRAAAPAYGSFWHRLGALVIDIVLVAVFFFIGGFMVGLLGGASAVENLESLDKFGSGGTIVINIMLTAMVIGFNSVGGTPGKRMLGLRITNRDGLLPGPALATIRAWPWIVVILCNLAMYLAVRTSDTGDVNSSLLEGVAILGQVIWLVGCFFVLGTKHKQALHDKLAGTYVIRT